MASKKVNIQIDTKADTTGAKQAETAVEKVTDATKQAGVEQKRVARETAAAEKQAAKEASDAAKQLARDKKQAAREAAEAQKKAAREASQEERRAARESAEAVKLASVEKKKALMEEKAAAAAAGAASQRVGTVVSQAGFQVQDFAVQVAGGTSALTAMAQQAPQFLGVFGPGGAIAGALIAVGAIAAKVFMGMRDDSASAAEQAEFLAGAVEEIGKNAEKAVARDIDFGLAQIVAATEEAENLIDAYDRVTQAQNASATASLANAEKIRQAEIDLARLRGENVDELAAISAGIGADDAARQEAARQQIAAQNEQLDKARQQEEIAEQALLQSRSMLIDAENQRQKQVQILETLRAQRDELEKQAKERGSLSEGEIPFMLTPAAERAQKQLEDPAFQALIEATEARVNALDEQLQAQGGKLTEAVGIAAGALEKAMLNTATIAQTLAIEIPRIEETLQAETVKAQVSGLAEIGQAAAQEIQAIAESAKPETTGQAAALDVLRQAAADGAITANETAKVAAALQVLGSSINTGISGMNSNVSTLINAMNTLNAQVSEQKRQIDSINARIRSGN